MFYCSIVMLFFMSKIKSIKLLLSIIFKRFAVFFGLIKGVFATCWWILSCSQASRIYANTKSIVLAPDIRCL